MKKFLLSAIFSAMGLMAFNVSATPISLKGPVTINWTVYQSVLTDYTLTHSNSTHTANSTNVVLIYKRTSKQFNLDNSYFLKLLTNSFNTNLAKGDHLVTDGETLLVVDKTGTNVVLDITPVVSVNFSNNIHTAMETVNEKFTKTSATSSGTTSDSGFNYVSLVYDDSNQTTGDGTHTSFQFNGFSVSQSSLSFVSGSAETEVGSYVVTGAGTGTIKNIPSALGGSVIGSASGTIVDR